MSSVPGNQSRIFSAQTYRDDLVFLRDVFPRIDRSFSEDALRRFERLIGTLLADAEKLTFPAFAMGVAKCLAVADNAHTMALLTQQLNVAPLRLYWFSDGLYAIRAGTGPADLVGSRILRIEGRAPEAWLDDLREYVGGNSARRRTLSAFFLVSPDALACMAPTTSQGCLTIDYLPGSGLASTCTLEVTSPDRNIDVFPKQDPGLRLAAVDGISWRQVLDNVRSIPRYLRDSPNRAFHEWLPGHRAMYVGIRNTMSCQDFDLREYLDKVIEDVKALEARAAIVDLRFNDGGDYLLARKFCQALPSALDRDGRLFIITNDQTFSAGLILTALLKYFGGDRAAIVGEGPGDRPAFWAEGGVIDLPGTGLPVRCATHYHDWESGCRDPGVSPWFNVLYNVPGGSLEPEYRVVTTFTQYARGDDPVMDFISAQIADPSFCRDRARMSDSEGISDERERRKG